MAPTRGFAFAVSIALVFVLVGLPVWMFGVVAGASSLLQAGYLLVTIGGAAAIFLLIALGMRKDAAS